MQAILQYRNFRKRVEQEIQQNASHFERSHGRPISMAIGQRDESPVGNVVDKKDVDEVVDLGTSPAASPMSETFGSLSDKLKGDPRRPGETTAPPRPGGPLVGGTVPHTIRKSDNLITRVESHDSSIASDSSDSETAKTTGAEHYENTFVGRDPEDIREVYVVGYEGENDPMDPTTWSVTKRLYCTFVVTCIAFVVGFASSIDSSALYPAAADFGVSAIVEAMATGLFLVGFGVGALISGPISETIGRTPVYIATLIIYMLFIMACGLAPNIGAQLSLRFLAGWFSVTPMTCAGGTVSDLWSPLQRVYAFPMFAMGAFVGPSAGPIVGGWIVENTSMSWRWVEWVSLMISALVLMLLVFTLPETFPPILLKWKAQHLRELTGNDCYVAEIEIRQRDFTRRLLRSLYRPFLMTAQEPIIILVALYLSVIYIVLYIFLDGFYYIFSMVYGTGDGMTGSIFAAMCVGVLSAYAIVPFIYIKTKRELQKVQAAGREKLSPEYGLLFALWGGSICLPVGLIWIAWTSKASISIWVPIMALVPIGYGIVTIFLSCYLYIIDTYEVFAASGLAMLTFIPSVVSGGMVVVGLPFYENVGVQWTCTSLAIMAAVMVPVPYIFWKYGEKIRSHSKFSAKDAF